MTKSTQTKDGGSVGTNFKEATDRAQETFNELNKEYIDLMKRWSIAFFDTAQDIREVINTNITNATK